MRSMSDIKYNAGISGGNCVPCFGPTGCLRSAHSLFSRFLFPFFLTLGLCSCVKEDLSNCPGKETMLTLFFEYYPTGSESDLFADYIDQVEFYLYDQDRNHYGTYVTDTPLLIAQQGFTLQIDPGEYYIVAWANTPHTGSVNSDDEPVLDNYFLVHSQEAVTTGALYYAPDLRSTEAGSRASTDYSEYRIAVTENETNFHTLPFMGAHHTVEVYISGLEADGLSTVSVEGLSKGYDFYLNTLTGETVTFTQKAAMKEVEDEGVLLFASFHIPHFDDENRITVHVAYGDKESEDEVELQDYIRRNGLVVNHGDPQVIPILFEYREGTFVQVTFPGWISSDVGVGF